MNEYYKNKVALIANKVCNGFGINILNLSSKKRYRDNIIIPRQLIWFICRELYPVISLQSLGDIDFLGIKDHATVLHGIKHAKNMIDTDKDIRRIYEVVKAEIKALDVNRIIEHDTKRISENEILISKLIHILYSENELARNEIKNILQQHEKVNNT